MRYRSIVSHNGIGAGEEVEIPDEQLDAWADEIGMGFLFPVVAYGVIDTDDE